MEHAFVQKKPLARAFAGAAFPGPTLRRKILSILRIPAAPKFSLI